MDPLKGAPPLVAFTTVALGGFRILVADILWLRASYLQDAGKYFELVQLSDWIAKLEPHCAEIWAFHAWNMAYNVSVMMPDPEDRWRWVKNGIQLLRDEGIPCHRSDPGLYCELGWLFQHKIGGSHDRAEMHYKRRWAQEMMQLFDGARPEYDRLAREPDTAGSMREEYKLIPGIMQTVDLKYGPLDWRLPESHAIYWAHRGKQYAQQKDSLRCDRMIFQSMVTSFNQGCLVFRKDDGLLRTKPNVDILPNVLKIFETALEKYPCMSIRTAYSNFLRDAIFVLRGSGNEQKAREIFVLLRDKFPSADTVADFESFVTTGNQGSEKGRD